MTVWRCVGSMLVTASIIAGTGPAWARKPSDVADISRGRNLILIGGCNDCHTPGFADAGLSVPENQWLTGSATGYRGAWGVSYASNLRQRLDGLGESEWLALARQTWRPPMPSIALQSMSDADLRAIYRYIRHLGPAGQSAPAHVAPGVAITTAYVDFVPKPAPVTLDATAAMIQRLGLEESVTPVRERAGWAPPRKVLVWDRAPQVLPTLQAAVPGVELLPAGNAADALRLARDVDVAIGFCSADLLNAAPRLQWIQVFWAGVEDCVTVPGMRERNVLLTNMQRVAGPVMAEHVMAMMLAFSRGLQFYIPERMAGRWTEEPPDSVHMATLEGKTVLVVGLGGIGTEVARRAHALGMRVVATRASGRAGPDYVSYVGLPDELRKLAAAADFIVNTTPLTPATTGIFDAGFFAAAKQGAYFINVGRGGSVVEADLVAALASRRIAGAGLDVTEPEPLPASSPLWRMQNVILTPHVSADSDLGIEARIVVIAENLRRYVAGDRMLSVVDLEQGY